MQWIEASETVDRETTTCATCTGIDRRKNKTRYHPENRDRHAPLIVDEAERPPERLQPGTARLGARCMERVNKYLVVIEHHRERCDPAKTIEQIIASHGRPMIVGQQASERIAQHESPLYHDGNHIRSTAAHNRIDLMTASAALALSNMAHIGLPATKSVDSPAYRMPLPR